MSYVPRSLFRLLEDIDGNRTLLPHIQRPFVWNKEQMERLFDSLMRDYPIQTFLFWRTKEEIRARRFMSIVDLDADLSDFYDLAKSAAGVEKVFVLDGQQRLQTLHAIFRGGIRDESSAIAEAYCDLMDGANSSESSDIVHKLVFSQKTLPLPMFRVRDLAERFASSNSMVVAEQLNDELENYLSSETPDERRARERRVRANIQQLDSVLNYDKHFWVDELDGVAKEYPYRRILEIFVRVNSGGTRLTAGDLMFAAMKEGWEDIEQRVEQTVDLLNSGRLDIDQDFVLKCLLLAHGRGAEVKTEKFSGPGGSDLLQGIERDWDRAEAAFRQLRDFMTHEIRAISNRVIRTYNALIPLFDFLFHNPQPTPENRRLMAAYYHKAQIFGWYGAQTDGVLNALHGIVGAVWPSGFPLDGIKKYFSDRGLRTELTSDMLAEPRLRNILLNIVYAERWGISPFDVSFKGNEPHVDHIYPQHMLRTRLSCRSAEINDIGNLRFVGATDNIRKRAELPSSYFSRLKTSGVDIYKHLLVDEFAVDPLRLMFDKKTFDDFRRARREEIWRSVKRAVDVELL